MISATLSVELSGIYHQDVFIKLALVLVCNADTCITNIIKVTLRYIPGYLNELYGSKYGSCRGLITYSLEPYICSILAGDIRPP